MPAPLFKVSGKVQWFFIGLLEETDGDWHKDWDDYKPTIAWALNESWKHDLRQNWQVWVRKFSADFP